MLVLAFRVLGVAYAVAVARVVEVVPRVGLRAIPHAPTCLAGLLHYRGQVVPVVDLGRLIGDAPSADRLDTRIILVDARRDADRAREPARLIGLVAEGVNDVRRVDEGRRASARLAIEGARYLGPAFETDAGILQLVEPGEIPDGSADHPGLAEAAG